MLFLLLVEVIVRSSTGPPTVFHPMSSSATVLARVDVCRDRVGRASRTVSFLVVGFAFPLRLTFPDTVDLHPVIIFARYISGCHGRIRSKEWLHCNHAARLAAQLGYVPNCKLFLRKIGICQRSSRGAFPFSDIQLPGSQA